MTLPTENPTATATGPLAGLKVVEMGQLLAGPWASTLLGYYGAQVVKLEPPGGDPIRGWRHVHEGTSLWWRSLARNKHSVVVDLHKPEGQTLAKELIGKADVLVENFRPGTLEKWGLSPEALQATNPGLIVSRISGFGQTGPYAPRPGFASVCEAMGGLRYVNGIPGEPPIRANLSLGDTLAGLHSAFGVLLALYQRDGKASGKGQVVDTSIFESVINMLESTLPEYAHSGVIREPSGTTVSGIVPTGTYLTKDQRHVVIGANGDSMFRRLCEAMDRPELAEDPRYRTNALRVEHVQDVDGAVAAFARSHTLAEVEEKLRQARIPAGPIYNAKDLVADPQVKARELVQQVPADDGQSYPIPKIMPELSATPGNSRWAGPSLGAHTKEVLQSWLNKTSAELEELAACGAIHH